MLHWVESAAWLWLALAIVACPRLLLRPRRGNCPGPPLRWRALSPWPLRTCGYELPGPGTCPECGAIHRTAPRTPLSRVLRSFVPSALCLVAAITCHNARWIVTMRWVSHTPAPILAAIVTHADGRAQRKAIHELTERAQNKTLTTAQARSVARAATAALRADDTSWNALHAMELLRLLGDDAVPALETALDSRDYQKRQLAADLLCTRVARGEDRWHWLGPLDPYDPPDRLFEVIVEGLGDDALPYDRIGAQPRTTWVSNAFDGVVFLVEHAERARPFLAPALASTDTQAQFLGAVAAAFCGEVSLVDQAAPILIRHLKDNVVGGDAAAATRALFLFGSGVLPHVRPLVAAPGKQEASLAKLIILDLEQPGRPLPERKALNTVTTVVADPATDLSIGQIRELWR